MENPEIENWLKAVLFEEIIPTLEGDKDELETYANEILERFANPFIRHELQSIALNSISKFKVRVLPSILAFHQKTGNWPKKLCEAFAATFLFYKGEFKGVSLPLNDLPSVADFFKQAWKNPDGNKIIEEVLGNTELWGEDLNFYPGLKTHLTQSLEKLKLKLGGF